MPSEVYLTRGTPEPPPVDEVLAGKCVVLSGITSKPMLNGRIATVGEYNRQKGRYHVLSVTPRRGDVGSSECYEVLSVSLKAENLTEATKEQEAQDRELTRRALDAQTEEGRPVE